jgi:hypothetical protein
MGDLARPLRGLFRGSILSVSPFWTVSMYYDDEARRFNFLSGLTLGTVLGAGLALLMAPRTRRGVGPAWKQRASAGLEKLCEGVVEPVADTLAAGRKHLNR